MRCLLCDGMGAQLYARGARCAERSLSMLQQRSAARHGQ